MQRQASSIIRDSGLTLVGGLGPLVIALVTVPLLIQFAGAARFGALTIVWLMLVYFGQADFGIGRAVTQRIAGLEEDQAAARARTIWTGLLVIGAVGLVTGALAAIFAQWFFSGPFDVPSGLRAELKNSIAIVAASIPLVALFGVAHGSLIGTGKFGFASLTMLIGNGAMQLLPLAVAVWWNNEMPWLVAASLVGRGTGLVVALAGVWLNVLKGQKWQADRQEASRLLHFGKWVMVTALIGPLMVLTDRLAIGVQLGAIAVAAYAVPFQVANRTLVFPQAILTALFPRFVAMDHGRAANEAARAAIVIGNLYAVPVVALICLAEPLLQLWIGSSLDDRSVLVARVLLAGFWINAVAQVPYNLLQARGNPRFVAILHALELPIYVVLLIGLGGAFGLAGFAAAFALRCAIDCFALFVRSDLNGRQALSGLSVAAGLVLVAAVLDPVLHGWFGSTLAAAVLGGIAAWRALTTTPPELLGRIGWKTRGDSD